MNSVDMQASVNNATQIDKLQQENHKGPTVYQGQNAEISERESIQKTKQANDPESTQDKSLDSKSKNKVFLRKKRKNKKRKQMKSGRSYNNGRFVDVTV